ncbi:PolyA polymerase cid [Entamoeba marina]
MQRPEDLLLHVIENHSNVKFKKVADDEQKILTSQLLIDRYDELKRNSPKLQVIKRVIEKGILPLYNSGSAKIEIYGSSEFDFVSSDVDATLILNDVYSFGKSYDTVDSLSMKRNTIQNYRSNYKEEKIEELEFIIEKLNTSIFKQSKLVEATVPIINCKINNIDIDISIDNFEGVYNTQLIKEYYSIHQNIAPIIYFIKIINKRMNLIDAHHGKFNSFTITIMVLYYLQQKQLIPNLQDLQFIEQVKRSKGKIIIKRPLILNSKVEYVSASNPQMVKYQNQLDGIDIVEVIKNYFKFYNEQRFSETISISPHILPREYKKSGISVFAPFVGFFNITSKLKVTPSELSHIYSDDIDENLNFLISSRVKKNVSDVLVVKKIYFDTTLEEFSYYLRKFKPQEILFYSPSLYDTKSTDYNLAFVHFQKGYALKLLQNRSFVKQIGFIFSYYDQDIFVNPPNGYIYYDCTKGTNWVNYC